MPQPTPVLPRLFDAPNGHLGVVYAGAAGEGVQVR
jgi:hypothetical protein